MERARHRDRHRARCGDDRRLQPDAIQRVAKLRRHPISRFANAASASHLLEEMRVGAADLELLRVAVDGDDLPPAEVAADRRDGLALTSVARWICQKRSGSSSSISSLIGFLIKASNCAVCTRVYFSSDWKNSTSSTGISRRLWPTDAWIHWSRGVCRRAADRVEPRREARQQRRHVGRVDRRRRGGRLRSGAGAHPGLQTLDRLREPLAVRRLEHVVDRALLEGLDRVLVVGGDEDDLAALSSRARIVRAASMPVMPGMRMSRNAKSGSCSSTSWTASLPFFASATNTSSGQASDKRARNCSRIRRSSSARTAVTASGRSCRSSASGDRRRRVRRGSIGFAGSRRCFERRESRT